MESLLAVGVILMFILVVGVGILVLREKRS